jgi:hypothetical protein
MPSYLFAGCDVIERNVSVVAARRITVDNDTGLASIGEPMLGAVKISVGTEWKSRLQIEPGEPRKLIVLDLRSQRNPKR